MSNNNRLLETLYKKGCKNTFFDLFEISGEGFECIGNTPNCLSRCCYSAIIITREEVDRLDISREEIIPLTDKTYIFNDYGKPCKFLNTLTNKCSIYQKRFLRCRIYPFYLIPSRNKIMADRKCPGIFIQRNSISVDFREITRMNLIFYYKCGFNDRIYSLIDRIIGGKR